ncbi:hypothetical protein ACHAQK_010907 [Fusarium lateritium]
MEEKCHLLAAPNEVLRLILDKVSEPSKEDNRHEKGTVPMPSYNDLTSMALVCRRLNSIATVTLYECIHIRTANTSDKETQLSPVAACVRLYETLRDKSELRSHCRRFVLDLGNALPVGDQDSACDTRSTHQQLFEQHPIIMDCSYMTTLFMSAVKAIICWLINTRTVVLSTGDTSIHSHSIMLAYLSWRIAVSVMKNLQFLCAINPMDILYSQLDLILYFKCISPCKSKHVEISGIFDLEKSHRSQQRLFYYEPSWLPYGHNGHPILELKSLVLVNLPDHPRLVQDVVAWIKAIEHFVLKWDDDFPFLHREDRVWNLSTVSDILQPHRQNLKSIEIGKMAEPGLGSFDVTNFPNLEALTMHSDDLDGVDIQTDPQLQTPKLRQVTLLPLSKMSTGV